MDEKPLPFLDLNRRNFLAVFSALGLSHTLLPGVLWGMAQEKSAPDAKATQPQTTAQDPVPSAKITREMLAAAAAIAGVHIEERDQEMMLDGLNDQLKDFKTIYDLHLPNSMPMALVFNPVLPGNEQRYAAPKQPMRMSAKVEYPGGAPNISRSATPKELEQVAFFTVRQLAELVRNKRVSSTALTEMYLTRLKRYDPLLHFVITLTEERAMTHAREADREIAAGKYRGPLHGLPWGAKDLLAVAGHPTTWGAGGFEHQSFHEDATVVQRLDAAGAVLVAKLTLGALAMDDGWFGGRTRNPWLPSQGSSGSSAGSASATAAGCVAFAIGSETLGSISSPSTRCGCTGLRPTYGRVPKTGAMALSWSMDKLGPICRAAEDTALVLSAIHGPDGVDPDVHDFAFNWDAELDVRKLRVGYLKTEFEKAFTPSPENEEEENERAKLSWEIIRKANDNALAVLQQKVGLKLTPVELPKLPWSAIADQLTAEGAAAFDELTRSGRDKLLTGQTKDDWPNLFRMSRFYPAVEYVQATRARYLGMQKAAEVFQNLDVIVAPTGGGSQLTMTNLTGHPAVIVPHGFRPADFPVPVKQTQAGGPGTPVSITFLADLYAEAKAVAVAKAFQEATDFHLKRPPLDDFLAKMR